ncbi:hypothetical protein MHYP_G00232410 [Metynnis hypsauchen]
MILESAVVLAVERETIYMVTLTTAEVVALEFDLQKGQQIPVVTSALKERTRKRAETSTCLLALLISRAQSSSPRPAGATFRRQGERDLRSS